MTTTEKIHDILGIDESYKAPERVMEILLGDKQKRMEVFQKFNKAFNYDFRFDWFHEYFEDEHADRKEKKQDFTPQSVADLLTALCGHKENTTYYEPCAGTGGIVITDWWKTVREHPIALLTYRPSKYFFHVEELSDRAIPFLLLNLMIRGMNAIVVHGDVLSRECKGIFFVVNESDVYTDYSSLNVMPYTSDVEKYFKVKFTDFRYPQHVETVLENE